MCDFLCRIGFTFSVIVSDVTKKPLKKIDIPTDFSSISVV